MKLLAPLARIFGILSPVHIRFVTLTSGAKLAGVDSLGNKYFEAKPRKGYRLTRRWVVYKGEPDASSVPPEWHGWLHHQSDVVPTEARQSYRRQWQKPPQANLTGTQAAYHPPGSLLSGGKRDKSGSDYEAWSPDL